MKLSNRNLYLLVFLAFGLNYISVAQSNKESKIRTVVLDAGHGGHDPGNVNEKNNFIEKDVALTISLMLGQYIEKNLKDVKVVYTRKTDVFVKLFDRAEIANRNKADLFICIHCNSACFYKQQNKKKIKECKEEVTGAETYVMGLHVSDKNLEVAKRENESVLLEKDYKKNYDGFDPNSDEASIIFAMYQNKFLDNSLDFAAKVEEELSKIGRVDRGVKQAGFLVLWRTAMPSVLIETGYLSNYNEGKFLTNKATQDKMAFALFNAFRGYKFELEGKQLSTDDKNLKANFDTSQSIIEKIETPEVLTKTDVLIEKPIVIAIKTDSLKQASTEKPILYTKPINTIEPLPNNEKIIFKIQILSSPKKISLNAPDFKNKKGIDENYNDNLYRYTLTQAINIEEALKNLDMVKSYGFKDCFVTAYKGKLKITVSEAKSMLNLQK